MKFLETKKNILHVKDILRSEKIVYKSDKNVLISKKSLRIILGVV